MDRVWIAAVMSRPGRSAILGWSTMRGWLFCGDGSFQEVNGTMKRTLTTLAVAIVTVLATAATALADYPPTANVKRETIQSVSPDRTIAFTGSDTI
jgi:hypothetical protein